MLTVVLISNRQAQNMKVVIISESASFPWGMAATSRVKLIAKGLMHLGYSIEYVGLIGARVNYSKEKKKNGEVEGVPFCYPGLFAVRPENWLARRLDDLWSNVKSKQYIHSKIRSKSLKFIILYTRKYNIVKRWVKFANKYDIKIILEICEWPEVYNNKTKDKILYCKYAPSMVSGVIPISKYIENSVRGKNKNVFRLPILIDSEKYERVEEESCAEVPYLVYSGSSNYYDILKLIIKSIYLLKQEGLYTRLKITGVVRRNYRNNIINMITNYGLSDIVKLTGYLEEDELIELMVNACALLAPIPDDSQTKARFPTKIGIYLASGTPVITNPYGEVENYLTDKKNVIFMSKYTAQELKNKICAVQ